MKIEILHLAAVDVFGRKFAHGGFAVRGGGGFLEVRLLNARGARRQ